MTRHRTRPRPATAAQGSLDPRQDTVDQAAAELAALYRAFPYAIAADSAGQMTGDRHSTGGSKNVSPLLLNTKVLSVTMRLDRHLAPIQAQAVAILNLERRRRDTIELISALPDWHRSLAARNQPLAREIRDDLPRLVRAAQAALGLRQPDKPIGADCPDHRADRRTPLVQEGDHAILARSLVAGPPARRPRLTGPLCKYSNGCDHEVCTVNTHGYWIHRIRAYDETRIERRVRDSDGHRFTDWVLDAEDEITWSSRIGEPAIVWNKSKTILCHTCRRTWLSTSDLRQLAQQLLALGDGDAAINRIRVGVA